MWTSNLTAATLLFVALVSSSCALTDIEIDNHYRRINPPAVHKFLNPKEGTILCVRWSVFHQSYAEEEAREGHPLIFKGNPANSCPEGTVQVAEISRTNMESHLKAIEAKKRGSMLHSNIDSSSNRFQLNSTAYPLPDDNPMLDEVHEYAIVTQKGEFVAASGWFDIWKPHTRYPAPFKFDFSLAQIWVSGGSHQNTQETIEAGWEVCPISYRNEEGNPKQPRFFIQYSRNNYDEYYTNLECPPEMRDECFTPTRADHIVGRAFNDLSKLNRRVFKEITIFKGPLTNEPGEYAWYISAGGEIQGYIKSSFFTHHLNAGYADEVDMGGEVCFYEPRDGPKPPHSTTEMGNAHYGHSGLPLAATVSRMRVVDAPMNPNKPYPLPRFGTNVNSAALRDVVTKAGCYDSYHTGEMNEPRDMFYGGPGWQPQRCP